MAVQPGLCRTWLKTLKTGSLTTRLTFSSRLYGSYEALKGGNVADALTDFTGGITEGYILRGPNADVPRNIVNILFKALDRQSLIGCGINVS